jgi:hypothetical protein
LETLLVPQSLQKVKHGLSPRKRFREYLQQLDHLRMAIAGTGRHSMKILGGIHMPNLLLAVNIPPNLECPLANGDLMRECHQNTVFLGLPLTSRVFLHTIILFNTGNSVNCKMKEDLRMVHSHTVGHLNFECLTNSPKGKEGRR